MAEVAIAAICLLFILAASGSFWFGMKLEASSRDAKGYKNALDLQTAITKTFLKIALEDQKTSEFLDRLRSASNADDIDRLYEEHLRSQAQRSHSG